MSQESPSFSSRALFILSVATGYGGAERNIEILLPRIPPARKVVVFACNRRHLAKLRKIDRPNLEIHFVDAAQETFAEEVGRVFIERHAALQPSAILANTLDSLRILSYAASELPGIDRHAFCYVHDFQWFDYEHLLASLPGATLLVPDRSVLEKPNYVGRYSWPQGAMRSLVVPNAVAIPAVEREDQRAGARFLHLATVNPFKGHALLAEAAALLRQSDPAIKIDSYGDRPIPELYRDILHHIAEVGAGDTLTLHDHIPDPSPHIKAARAILVTSVSEGGGPETFGRTIIEAWACGRPVIAFAAGAPGRLIRHGVDGLLVDEKDTSGLAAAVLRLHRDPGLADELGRAGRERALQAYSSEAVARQLLSVLDGEWRRSVEGGPPVGIRYRPEAQGGRLLFDVSLSLDLGWQTPVGLSRVENDVAEQLARQPDADILLVSRGADDGAFRRLTPLELEFLTNRRGGLAQLAARELEASAYPPAKLQPMVARSFEIGAGRPAGNGQPVAPAPLRVRSGDTLICVSNPWDYVPANFFRQLRNLGVRLVLVVHDLMVWETPHWTAGQDPRTYSRNMLAIIAEAERVIAVSEATATVLKKAFASIGKRAPPVSVAAPAGLSPSASLFGSPPRGLDRDRPFVVYCSTIEVRKNHIMLLTLWDRLRTCLPMARLPVLVLVGKWGWQVDAVRLMVERNWRLAPHLRILDDVRDESLIWLYRHARFTVFPSFAEGFGLAAAESLGVGTPVVVSNHPALVEASQALMPAIDPYDLPAWHREIAALCLDDGRLAELRKQAGLYRAVDPQELPRTVITAAMEGGRRH